MGRVTGRTVATRDHRTRWSRQPHTWPTQRDPSCQLSLTPPHSPSPHLPTAPESKPSTTSRRSPNSHPGQPPSGTHPRSTTTVRACTITRSRPTGPSTLTTRTRQPLLSTPHLPTPLVSSTLLNKTLPPSPAISRLWLRSLSTTSPTRLWSTLKRRRRNSTLTPPK